MELLNLLMSNYLINVGVLAWFSAQLLKTVGYFVVTGRWNPERMFGAGGMPSSHSALVCAITIGMARKMGYASPEFALSLTMAAIVMYDAMGVRRAAGEQAKVINKIVFGFKYIDLNLDAEREEEELLPDPEQKKLKEYLGHTPFEVLGGALLGILIAIIVPVI